MKTFYEKTILENIDFTGYDGYQNDQNDFYKIKSIFEIFKSEYDWRINQVGQLNGFSEWLSGLPSSLTVPFYYDEMIQNAKDFGLEVRNEELFCKLYFDKLSLAFFNLMDNL